MSPSRISPTFLAITLLAASTFAQTPSPQNSKTYSYKGCSVSYPDSWSLDEQTDGNAAYIYDHSDGTTRATWNIVAIVENPRNLTAEQFRDNFARVAAKKFQQFALKEKGLLTVAGKHPAFLRFTYTGEGHHCVERNIVIPIDNNRFIICREFAFENDWEKEAASLDRITRSISLK